MIPGSANPLLLASAAAAGGYQIERSLRFNSADSAYLSRTPAVVGNRKKWTWSGWLKKSNVAATQGLFTCTAGGGYFELFFDNTTQALVVDDGGVYFYGYTSATSQSTLRDTSAWYHIVLALDSANATQADRLRLWVNGRLVGRSAELVLDQEYNINVAGQHEIGQWRGASYLSGYLAEIHFIDGQALDYTSFTEVSATTGQLVPIAYTGGSYGTNGFYLQFADNSSNTAATLGKDTSGNSNNWTPNNFQATVQTGRLYAQASGTSTSAFSSATLLGNFPATVGGSYAIYDADLITSTTSATFSYTHGFSAAVEVLVSADGTSWTSKGNQSSAYTTVTNASAFRYVRWFYSTFNFGINNNPAGNDSLVDTPTSFGTDTGVGNEVRGNYCTLNPLGGYSSYLANGNLDYSASGGGIVCGTIALPSSGKWYWEISPTTSKLMVGIQKTDSAVTDGYLGVSANGYGYDGNDGKVWYNATGTAYGNTFTSGNVIGVAFDADNGKLFFSIDNTWQNSGNPLTGANPAASSLTGSWIPALGRDSATAAGSANFGQRAFAYTAPSGFKALCDTNLPTPLVAKPNTLMDVALYTGNGGNQSITLPGGFNPDLVWVKSRSNSQDHYLFDAVRGGASILRSNTTGAESTGTAYLSFDTSGFSSLNGLSSNGYTYAAWTWDAGSSTVSNTAGSITSQVRANVSAGFSVVTYTGTGTAGATVGHGLGVAPGMIITKSRSNTSEWVVYHMGLATPSSQRLELQSTAAVVSSASDWSYTNPSSTVVTLGTSYSGNFSGYTHVMYCFAPVVGYSSFGSYTGNGSADGPFVYTGFRPRVLIIKRADASQDWIILDAARNAYNVCDALLYPNASYNELYVGVTDFLSNGFKHRFAGTTQNTNGGTYIYAAFAENPFQYARAR